MLIAAIIGFCLLILVLAFLLPRLSTRFQRAGEKPLQVGQRTSGRAPGKLGEWLQKPFGKSRRAVGKSGSEGRKARAKAPF